MFSFSEHYTEVLKGKTIESVDHHFYGTLTIYFTDGTCARLDPSGQPPTIFIKSGPVPTPLMTRVFTTKGA